MASDEYYMARAQALAETAEGRTSPNPAVGCVVVRDGEVVGEGYHPGAGQPHAEVFALKAAGPAAEGATVYVTLEPCSSHGRTPPCTDALLSSGVREVVYGTTDPDPRHSGSGLKRLLEAGVAVRRAGDEESLRALNRGFFAFMERGRPDVSAKVAVTLDGRVTLEPGSRTGLSGQSAIDWVHRWRSRADAVLVGVDTVLVDDPLLTARPPEGCPRQPVRVVLDSSGRLPAGSQLVATAGRVPLLVLTTEAAPDDWRKDLRARGVDIEVIEDADGKVDLGSALSELGQRGLLEVAVEPGPRLLGSIIAAGLVDRLHLIFTPVTGGDPDAPRWFDALGPGRVPEGTSWSIGSVMPLGADAMMTIELETEDPADTRKGD